MALRDDDWMQKEDEEVRLRRRQDRRRDYSQERESGNAYLGRWYGDLVIDGLWGYWPIGA